MAIEHRWSGSRREPPQKGQVGHAAPGLFPPDSLVVDILVLDKSGSMQDEGFKTGRSKLELVEEAVGRFLGRKYKSRPLHMVGFVPFTHTIERVYDPANIRQARDALCHTLKESLSPPHGGTDVGGALIASLQMLQRGGFLMHNSPFFCRVLLYSDGHTSNPERAILAAQALKEHNVLVETLGLGKTPSDVAEELMMLCASRSGEFVHYRFLADIESLLTTYEDAATATLIWGG
jgi:Mg-chelatase subunit ChlD